MGPGQQVCNGDQTGAGFEIERLVSHVTYHVTRDKGDVSSVDQGLGI